MTLFGRWTPVAMPLAVFAVALVGSSQARGEKVVLKNGIVYRGAVDRDNTIVWVFDGLKRVVLRDSKIDKTEADSTFGTWEVFRLVQPLIQHAGTMPREVYDVEATPWNDRGRRTFSYKSARSSRPIRMEQAIYELGPYLVKLRGVDGFWAEGRLNTTQVPREVVLGLLAKVDQSNQNERRRVASFLIQAEWYTDAKREIDGLIRDFPSDADLRDSLSNARTAVAQLEATQLKAEIDVRRKALQPRWAAGRLKTFPTKDVASETLVSLREQIRADAAQDAADKALADALQAVAKRLPAETQLAWKSQLVEVFKVLAEAPDAVRDRFSAWEKVREEPAVADDAQFALAMSGYAVGADAAVTDPATAVKYWEARALLQTYFSAKEAATRTETLDQLQSLTLPDDPSQTTPTRKLDVLTRLAVRMPPPLHDEEETPGRPRICRVRDDENAEPTEYTVLLPPEYHPLRSYPALVALHAGNGPRAAIAWWEAEAQRRGYIVIAPEFKVPGQAEYGFTTSEHAAVELALRDARRRFAIDSDRVFLGGQLNGGAMAWDFGLAHPDLFAGVVVISGLPLKYVYRYLPHVDRLPLYVALGDLAPAGNEIVFTNVVKPLILKAYDVTYSEYYRRGLEDFPEEAPQVFDWMDRRRRDPYPKTFKVVSARDSDARFNGVIIQEFLPGFTTAPEAVDAFGKNLNPATLELQSSNLSNLLKVQTKGIKRLDVWVPPRLIDFKKKIEVRVNGKSYFKALAKPNIEPFLEDLRLRGDRQQIYWLKVSAG